MKKSHQRLYFILFILACLGGALGLSLYALQDNISFFYSPSEIKAFRVVNDTRVAEGRVFRLGGMVKDGSVKKRDGDLSIRFIVTDFAEETPVEYKGLLPDLFREGQGVVAKGTLNGRGIFMAVELLAKHDENYMPPGLADKMKAAP
jgi:cytochrome c-type biogenesis protein CcmE